MLNEFDPRDLRPMALLHDQVRLGSMVRFNCLEKDSSWDGNVDGQAACSSQLSKGSRHKVPGAGEGRPTLVRSLGSVVSIKSLSMAYGLLGSL